MRKRKGGSETLVPKREEEEEEEESGKGFFACYLLCSLSPRHKGHTYIGFTVNPRRRIRQHNGEIGSGAWRTKRKRPWEMILCIYGFPTNVSALQFEWAWQHPIESLSVRSAAANFKSLSGIANKIRLAYTMLTLPSWQSLDLTVNFFSTKYKNHTAGCLPLPENMKVQISSMDDLPCYTGTDQSLYEHEDFNDLPCYTGIDHSLYENEDFNDRENTIETELANDFLGEGLEDKTVYESSEENTREKDHNSLERASCLVFPDSLCVEDTFNNDASRKVESSKENGTREKGHNSPEKTSCFVFPGTLCVEDTFNNDADRDFTDSLCAEDSFKNDDASREVEIIDLFTPSPDCRSLCNKKRRSSIHPQIIDLTESPIFVQL